MDGKLQFPDLGSVVPMPLFPEPVRQLALPPRPRIEVEIVDALGQGDLHGMRVIGREVSPSEETVEEYAARRESWEPRSGIVLLVRMLDPDAARKLTNQTRVLMLDQRRKARELRKEFGPADFPELYEGSWEDPELVDKAAGTALAILQAGLAGVEGVELTASGAVIEQPSQAQWIGWLRRQGWASIAATRVMSAQAPSVRQRKS